MTPETRCPTCESPDPNRHPAMQWEGEVQPCRDPFHLLRCVGCGEATFDRTTDRCTNCGATEADQHEQFRQGWDGAGVGR